MFSLQTTFTLMLMGNWKLYAPGRVAYSSWTVRQSVCQYVCMSVCPSVRKNFNIGHYFFTIEDSNLIFGMHVYLMKLHILSGERSRSRSSFKVRGQIYVAKIAHFMNTFAILKIAIWYLACMCISWSCTFWVVKGEGHTSILGTLRFPVNLQSR